jgi:hypothetical protein
MAKKTARRPVKPAQERASVTPERFARLNLLVTLLAKSPQTREVLARKLKLDVRGFYRDLEALRLAGITVTLAEGRYKLTGPLKVARNGLPFPDPMLTLGEVTQLAKGRTAVHRHLEQMIARRLK